MNPELQKVAEHMREFGINSLAHAIHMINSPYPDSDFGAYKDDLAVLQAAHAAEILGKAAIAEQHPLLIFVQLPKSTQVEGEGLEIKALFETGKTIGYQEIPERLWATTGYKIRWLDLYKEFGKLRNSIQHFASINHRHFLRYKTLQFIFGIIDPLINDFWSLYAVNCIEEGLYSDGYKDLYRTLLFWEIDFLIPDEFRHYYDEAKQLAEQQSHTGLSTLRREGLLTDSESQPSNPE